LNKKLFLAIDRKSSKSKDERILELEEENRKLKLERIEYMEENII